jgi:hypothetical protein
MLMVRPASGTSVIDCEQGGQLIAINRLALRQNARTVMRDQAHDMQGR